MKKIALIINQLRGGGAEKVAADLSVFMSNHGYEVFFFVGEPPTSENYLLKGKIVQISMLSQQQRFVSFDKKVYCIISDSMRLRRLKKEYGIDISISFMQTYNLINILSRYKDKVIVTIHSVISKRKDFAGTIGHNKWIFQIVYQLADKIVFVSKYCQDDWKKHYGDLFNKTMTIYNPVNLVRKKGNVNENKVFLESLGYHIVISVARFSGVKQQWHMIRVFSRVLDKCPDAHLLLLGDGFLKNSLKDLAFKMGISDNIHFIGHVSGVDEYLSRSRVFLQTSKSEACSCAIIEAMTAGVPIVANDCPGGNREIMDAVNQPRYRNKNVLTDYGIITPQLDGKKYTEKDELTRQEQLMADAVVELLLNEDLQKQMSSNCKEKAKQYDLEEIGKIWCEMIIEAKK